MTKKPKISEATKKAVQKYASVTGVVIPNEPKVEKQLVVIRQLFIDDVGDNKIIFHSTNKTVVMYLQLQADGKRKRKIGVITKSTKNIRVTRKRHLHLFRKGNAYGFNDYIFREAKTFNTITLTDDFEEWKFPITLIREEGKYLNFKQQGFELQRFLSLSQLEPYRIKPEENRRF